MPGHLVAAIACYPELSCTGEKVDVSNRWGVLDNIGCCGKENIYTFVKDVIDELSEIFTGEYFHIGGDEVPKTRWKKCPACQAKIKELGLKDENELQGHFNNEIFKYLKQKGKKMIGWNEVLESSEILDKDIIAQWWTGDRHSHASKLVKERLKDGGKIILSPWGHVYMDHPYLVRNLEKTYSLSSSAMGLDSNENILGVEAPQWTEYIKSHDKLDFNTFPRLFAISEIAWTNDEHKNYKEFEERLESLRAYFNNLNVILPHAKFYRGESLRFSRTARGWGKWRKKPNFEVKLWNKHAKQERKGKK
jgi:hexosaminidase